MLQLQNIWEYLTFYLDWKDILSLRRSNKLFYSIFKDLNKIWKIWDLPLTTEQIISYILKNSRISNYIYWRSNNEIFALKISTNVTCQNIIGIKYFNKQTVLTDKIYEFLDNLHCGEIVTPLPILITNLTQKIHFPCGFAKTHQMVLSHYHFTPVFKYSRNGF